MIDYDELKHKEEELRHGYCRVLHETDIDGAVDIYAAKKLRLYGDLWHHANELLKRMEEHGDRTTMSADKMEIHASGIKSIK